MFKIQDSIEQFLCDQELKGNTKKTIEYYSANLNNFALFLGVDKMTKDISLEDLRKYQFLLKSRPKFQDHKFKPKYDKPINNTTLQTYIRAVRAFIKWCNQEGHILDDLTKSFKLPKATKKTIEILSDEEIEILMKSMKQTTEMGLRNSCIIALMLDSGLRRQEVITLNVDNIHITQGCIKVLGKGQKERIVPLGLYTKKLLLKYMSGFRPLPEVETKRLFIDKVFKPITEAAVKQLFRRLRKKTKIDRLHPHMLRHTFATRYLMNGGDIFSLQQILGHTSLDMVRKYSHLASAYITQNYKRFSPLDNLESKKYK